MINFLLNNTKYIKNVGNICTFSEFNKSSNNKKMELSISMFQDNNSNIFEDETENMY